MREYRPSSRTFIVLFAVASSHATTVEPLDLADENSYLGKVGSWIMGGISSLTSAPVDTADQGAEVQYGQRESETRVHLMSTPTLGYPHVTRSPEPNRPAMHLAESQACRLEINRLPSPLNSSSNSTCWYPVGTLQC